MTYSDCCRDKLSHYRIAGQSKPFVDQNLQLQLPGWDSPPHQTSYSYSPIYSHYIGSIPTSSLELQVNETELYQAMTEAERSYKAWKQMHQQLREAATTFQS